MVESPFFFFRQ